MKNTDRNKLFLHYMEEVNYIEKEPSSKKISMSKFERAIALTLLSCIGIMTAWELIKEVVMKLRF